MNIPPVPQEGWTRAYLRQLRAVAYEAQPLPSLEDEVWLDVAACSLSEDDLDALSDATHESFLEFQRVEQIMLDDHHQDPQKRVDYLVASRRHTQRVIEAARWLFGERTPGVRSEGDQ